MKKKKYLLLLLLLFLPLTVFAKSGNSSNSSLYVALGFELFVTIQISDLVFYPISRMISENNSKKIFWILFIIRIIVLLLFDFLVTPMIAIFDFFFVFFGKLVIVPIVAKLTNSNPNDYVHKRKVYDIRNIQNIVNKQEDSSLKCPKCGYEIKLGDKFCRNCGAPIDTANLTEELKAEDGLNDPSSIVKPDAKYLSDESIILKDIINDELNNLGENINDLSTKELNIKRNIVFIIWFLVLLSCIVAYYFNCSYVSCVVLAFFPSVICFFLLKKYNIVNVLIKIIKNNPDKDISLIINDTIKEKKKPLLSNRVKLIVMVVFAVIIPSLIFMKPRMLYRKVTNGYEVSKYTRGLVSGKKDLVIPNNYKGKQVVGIHKGAFKNSKIKSIKLPDELEIIPKEAFYNCNNLEKITIPETVTEIRANAFEDDVSLVSIELPEGLINIRGNAFNGCYNLENIELPESLEYIGAGAFEYCSSLKEVTIPKKVIEINGETFAYCDALETVNLHDDIISIHGEVFAGDSSLEEIKLPSKITEIKGNTFEDCTSLKRIDIPYGVTRIGGHAFCGCTSLNYVNVPSTVEEIGSSAFRQCYALRTIKIPRNAYVNERAFKESPTQVYYLEED